MSALCTLMISCIILLDLLFVNVLWVTVSHCSIFELNICKILWSLAIQVFAKCHNQFGLNQDADNIGIWSKTKTSSFNKQNKKPLWQQNLQTGGTKEEHRASMKYHKERRMTETHGKPVQWSTKELVTGDWLNTQRENGDRQHLGLLANWGQVWVAS